MADVKVRRLFRELRYGGGATEFSNREELQRIVFYVCRYGLKSSPAEGETETELSN